MKATLRLTLLGVIMNCTAGLAQPTLLYFNDAHEMAPVDDGVRGGLARVATLIKQTREQNPDTLVVFGGDLVGGTLFGAFQGEPIVEAFNQMGVDIANFGQHEFDFGPGVARQRVQESAFTWLSTNLTDTKGRPFAGVPRILIREVGHIEIGFIGLTTALETTRAGPKITQQDPLMAATKAVEALEAGGVDKIVVIAQQTDEEDLALAEALPQIDLILSEESSETVTRLSTLGHTSIVKSAGNVTSVVRADLFADRTALSTLAVDADVPEAPAIAARSRRYMDRLEERLSERVGYTPVTLDASAEANRTEGTVLGNLIADSFKHALDADLALINGGGIRSDRSYPKGDLTLRDLSEMLPFGDQVVLLRLDGRAVRAMLENGVSQIEELDGRFAQVSGLSYHFDPSRSVGQRITRVRVGAEPLETNRLYTLATRAYLASGGDEYSMLSEAEVLIPSANGVAEVSALSEYLKNAPRIDRTSRAVRE